MVNYSYVLRSELYELIKKHFVSSFAKEICISCFDDINPGQVYMDSFVLGLYMSAILEECEKPEYDDCMVIRWAITNTDNLPVYTKNDIMKNAEQN